jgi:membrane complex biogenesis BtpA family protein
MRVRGLIGVVHLPPMPGDPRHDGQTSFDQVMDRARSDAEALARGGVDALLLENYGSTPFAKAETPPHQLAVLCCCARRCVETLGLPVGINCLRNDARSAMGIASAVGADFVRINVHTGAYVTDQGLIEGQAHRTLRYRQQLGATRVAILADILVKHATPLAPLDEGAAARDCIERGLADALIVTGPATGQPVDRGRLERVRRACGNHSLFVGSGLTAESAPLLAPLCDGAIVGTWLKQDGWIDRPVDVERVRCLVQIVRGRWRSDSG